MQTRIYLQLDSPTSRLHLLVLFACVGLGVWLRFYGYWAGESFHVFAINDEVSAFRVAMQFLAGEDKAFYLGQPNFSEGHAPGPVWTLFWVALFKLGGGVVNNALFYVTFLNSLVVFLVYVFARQLLTPGYALLSCFLFAISPWPVYYASGLWNPIPLAFLGVLLFISLWRVTQVEKSHAIFWVLLVSAVLPQFHMIGIFYYPAILLVLYLSPCRLSRGWLVVGILAGLLVYVPYLIGDMQHNWENTRLILSGGKHFSANVLKVISGPVTVLSNHPGRWLGDGLVGLFEFGDKWFVSKIILIGINVISIVLALAIVLRFTIYFFSLLKSHWKSPALMFKEYPTYSFVGILLFLPLLLFVFTGHNYSTRYTILIFPLLFVLPAFYIELAGRSKLKKLYLYSLPFMSLFSIYLTFAYFTHMANQIEGNTFFINSFKKMERVREKIKQHAGDDVPIELVIDKYIAQAPERLRISAVAEADYISIYEHYIEKKRAEKPKKYLLRYEKDSVMDTSAVAYQGNGIVIYSIE